MTAELRTGIHRRHHELRALILTLKLEYKLIVTDYSSMFKSHLKDSFAIFPCHEFSLLILLCK